ncbi:hypothetical protein [Micromonospora sp. KC721]|uniref:hypothetical protein n=1 Tax=Micromonospora sp. KC721 TaxID=2530380 RepID=UPI001A9E2428|nr:hypothetical protein [Micromonospora sp. KC721]
MASAALRGIYMQAGGVFLQPILALLEQKKLLKPTGQQGHITIVSNDDIPQELDALHKGHIDAAASQPADLYAKYTLYYAKAAAEGKPFNPGETDYGSTIVKIPNGGEDQLPAPLVTKETWTSPSGATTAADSQQARRSRRGADRPRPSTPHPPRPSVPAIWPRLPRQPASANDSARPSHCATPGS